MRRHTDAKARDLKPCPFCGAVAAVDRDKYGIVSSVDCSAICDLQHPASVDWNSRPIEDALRTRAEAAEAMGFARSMLTTEREPEPFVLGVAPDGRPRMSINANGPLSTAGMVDIAYRLADRDGDDRLSLAEVQAVGRTVFAAADRDHDGILDDSEREVAMEKLRLFRGVISAVK